MPWQTRSKSNVWRSQWRVAFRADKGIRSGPTQESSNKCRKHPAIDKFGKKNVAGRMVDKSWAMKDSKSLCQAAVLPAEFESERPKK